MPRNKGDHLWKKGQTGNPRGSSAKARNRARGAAELLEAALRAEANGGVDLLVQALVDGVKARETGCMRLACEYRWGKPKQHVQVEDFSSMSRAELERELFAEFEREYKRDRAEMIETPDREMVQ